MTVPWTKPKTAYESDGPAEPCTFTEQGATFCVTPTEEIGVNTGRMCYHIECLSCGEVLRKHSTRATFHVQEHLKRRHAPWPVGERLLSNKAVKEADIWGEMYYWRVLEFETCTVRFVEEFEDRMIPPNFDYHVECEVKKK